MKAYSHHTKAWVIFILTKEKAFLTEVAVNWWNRTLERNRLQINGNNWNQDYQLISCIWFYLNKVIIKRKKITREKIQKYRPLEIKTEQSLVDNKMLVPSKLATIVVTSMDREKSC